MCLLFPIVESRISVRPLVDSSIAFGHPTPYAELIISFTFYNPDSDT